MAGISKEKLIVALSKQLKILQGKDAVSRSLSVEELRSLKAFAYIAMEIKSSDGRVGYMSDKARAALEEAVSIVYEILQKEEYSLRATKQEVFSECRRVIGDHLIPEVVKLKGTQLVNSAYEALSPKVERHVFAMPLHGLEVDGLDRWEVGSFFLSKPDKSLLDVCRGDVRGDERIEMAWARMQNGVWLCGAAVGTTNFAEKDFFTGGNKIISALAIAFSLGHDKGAASMRIGITTERPRNWFGYGEVQRSLRVSWHMGGSSAVRCSQDHMVELRDQTDWFMPLVKTLLEEEPTELESAMQRAAHWFRDAQSDADLDMRFLKFWSCIECFFSIDRGKTTNQIIDGLSAVLIHGGLRLSAPDDWKALRKSIDKLYTLRSEAVHDARHGHISFEDVVTVSTWAAAVIVSMGALHQQGYTTRKELQEQINRLTAISSRVNSQGGSKS